MRRICKLLVAFDNPHTTTTYCFSQTRSSSSSWCNARELFGLENFLPAVAQDKKHIRYWTEKVTVVLHQIHTGTSNSWLGFCRHHTENETFSHSLSSGINKSLLLVLLLPLFLLLCTLKNAASLHYNTCAVRCDITLMRIKKSQYSRQPEQSYKFSLK